MLQAKISGQCTSLSIAHLSGRNLLPNACFQGENLLSNPPGLPPPPPLQVVVETNNSCIKLSGFSSFALFLQFPSRGLPRQKCCTSTQNSTEIKPENFVIIEPTVYMTAVTHRNQEIGLEIRKSDLKSRDCIINQQKSIYRSTEIRLEIKKVCYKSPEFEILYTFERCGGPLGFVYICAYC